MRTLLLTDTQPNTVGWSQHIATLQASLQRLGQPAEVVASTEYQFGAGGWVGPGLGEEPKGLVINRTSTLGEWSCMVASVLEAQGWVVLDSGAKMSQAADKAVSWHKLARRGVKVIPSALVSARSAVEVGFSYPVVVKARHGSSGAQVERARSFAEFKEVASKLSNGADDGVVVQPFVGGERARDLRVHVQGGEAKLILARTASKGEWRTNVGAGASSTLYSGPLAAEAAALAESAGLASGLFWAAVDLLHDREGGLWVCETNPSPGVKGVVSSAGEGALDELVRGVLLEGERLLPLARPSETLGVEFGRRAGA